MSIYSYLKTDHQKAKDLMNQIAALGESDQSKRDTLFNTLKQELILHAKTEEEAFYEPLKEFKATEEEVDHGEEEHQEIEALLEELSGNGLKGKAWQQKFSELQKSVEHHIQEEEGEIFADAKKVLDESTAQQMEIDMKSLKKEQKGILAASSDTL